MCIILKVVFCISDILLYVFHIDTERKRDNHWELKNMYIDRWIDFVCVCEKEQERKKGGEWGKTIQLGIINLVTREILNLLFKVS